MTWWRRGAWVTGLLVLAVSGWLYFGQGVSRSASPEQGDADAAALHDPALIARGEYLATVGDCAACHTARDGQRYAGGRSLATPFGDVPAPNITPDPETGIGRWNFDDFRRALHEGKGRQGELLYPVFSYTSFTKVTRDDALAIFAYLKSLPPVRRADGELGLGFPYNVRSSLLAWRALYFTPGEYQPDPAKSEQWNRGAYLVQGLGHCNECHAARDSLGGIAQDRQLTGGRIPQLDWYAPDLDTQPGGGLAGWSAQDIVDLLGTGRSAKGTAFGPMADVVRMSTQHMTEADLQAVATYLQALPPRTPKADAAPFKAAASHELGGTLYAQRCADCHGRDGRGVAGVYPPLDGNISVTEPTGINAIRSVLLGGFAPATAGNPQPYSMPPFAQQLSDTDVAAVVSYVRQSWSNKASAVQPADVGKYRNTPLD
ncbi:alcohol dehydrogenase [Rhodanobacter sp. FW510-R12]|uniref:cytochrome c n=1 Tax=unclassified Rhodanobacter TaxID=2621553 RepID=UPI0007AA4DE6|nr:MULTISPECIES: cytochrome c [unclassified Rhodanobacter]KZC15418.1 alcohol dehydrogenase [Rhodanobacter sp. FW104-R8]KZC27307.1 alcohol dehydrogenase [Rhodanobacter sp. FW510-T8]KZC31743.1 alcohol dehydrogenase [Rhodanobacter sp. FW510-R10]